MKRNSKWILMGAIVNVAVIAMLASQGLQAKKKSADCVFTDAGAQIVGLNGWTELPIFTIGESINGYTPPGIPDGMGAFKKGNQVRMLVNHELVASAGYPYTLANGAMLTGARVSYFDLDRDSFGVCDAGLAYDTIYNRAGEVVSGPGDLEFGGLNRLCSAQAVEKGTFGIKDDIFFTGEESGGGTEFALDVKRDELWAVPAMGRAAWENITVLDSGDKNKVAILIGDDRGGAPLLLYIGDKAVDEGEGQGQDKGRTFLEQNGLAKGKLFVWVADDGSREPADFAGTGNAKSGAFVEIPYFQPGEPGFDSLGYATQATQDDLADIAGAFKFSRPEDVATSPFNGAVAVLASTGRSSLFPADSWGTLYTVDVDFSNLSAELIVLYDGDDAVNQDDGIRSPDNLDWADDGYVYVQEDASFSGFGQTSGEEASIWKINPLDGSTTRIAQMKRTAMLPGGQTDPVPGDIGNWESSGIMDVSDLFGIENATLLFGNVQAHSVRDGSIAAGDLVQGGQLFFLLSVNEDDDE